MDAVMQEVANSLSDTLEALNERFEAIFYEEDHITIIMADGRVFRLTATQVA